MATTRATIGRIRLGRRGGAKSTPTWGRSSRDTNVTSLRWREAAVPPLLLDEADPGQVCLPWEVAGCLDRHWRKRELEVEAALRLCRSILEEGEPAPEHQGGRWADRDFRR